MSNRDIKILKISRTGLIALLGLLTLTLLTVPLTGEESEPPGAPTENARLLLLAENSYLAGLEMEEDRKGSGRESLLESAAYYQSLIEERGIRNGRIYYNQGNAYLSAGETGRAILAYRRALRFTPSNRELKNNLRQAEEAIINRVGTESPEQIKHILFFFHYEIPGKVKSLILLILSLFFWGILIINIFRPGLLRFSLIPLIPALIFATSLIVDAGVEKRHPEIVLTMEKTEARKGDAASYAPAFDAPLGGGTAGRRLADAGEWWYVKLDGGDVCWIPASSAELVSFREQRD
ncbi:MAG: hypothetical protein JEY99_19430 [Spirochaetales bacterium]|nr:hypothetical protein [Spirochaetales bacterium]